MGHSHDVNEKGRTEICQRTGMFLNWAITMSFILAPELNISKIDVPFHHPPMSKSLYPSEEVPPWPPKVSFLPGLVRTNSTIAVFHSLIAIPCY